MTLKLVIVGLGYVGLPLARESVLAGVSTVGLDVSQSVVDGLTGGHSHIDGISEDEVKQMAAKGFTASVDPSVIADADVVVVCVPTPLNEGGGPDMSFVVSAMSTVSEHLRPGQLVSLESTTYPGTTEEVVVPLLEKSGLKAEQEFFVGFSPERVDPGNATFTTRNTPKVVSGIGPESLRRMTEFYERVVDTVVAASGTKEAEAAKLLENTYRHLNIALVNELARVFHDLDIDIWEVVRLAATKPFGFQAFYPGPGVGGHCIPIDPNYLNHHVMQRLGYPVKLVELAQEVNSAMPVYVGRRIAELLNEDRLTLNGASVLVLGVTYKQDISDVRESPADALVEYLFSQRAHVTYHDPYVPTWHVGGHSLSSETELEAAAAAADVVVLLQNHSEYDVDALAKMSRRFFDTRGVTSTDAAVHL